MLLLLRAGLTLAASAIGLLVAALVFDQFEIDVVSFPIVVVVYTVIALLARPLVRAVMRRKAHGVFFLATLAATFLTLLVTDLLSDGLQIEGAGTWIFSTLIVWATTAVADLIFDRMILRRRLRRR